MNISIKKTAIASILVTGIAATLTLQANEVPDTLSKGFGAEGNAAMSMDMQDMQGMGGMMNMMGMSEQMGEMMSACTKMMEAHASDHHNPSGEDEAQG